jgi:integrase
MAKKRGHGEGTITRLPSGKWRGRVTIGRDREGRAIRKSITRKTRQEVAQELTKLLNQVQAGSYIEPSLVTVKQWFGDWLAGRKPHIEEKTYIGHELMIRRHILPEFGDMKLGDVRTRDVQKLLNEKLEAGLSVRTVKYIYTTLNMGFKQAIRERLITFNPADSDAVELPKQRKKEIQVLDREEMARFLEAAKKYSPHYTAFVLEMATGLRRGELLALRWTDVDLKQGTLAVNQQLVRSSKGLEFKGYLKTEKSRRTISLDEDITKALKAHRRKQEKWKTELTLKVGGEKAFKEIYRENNLLFCTDTGRPLDPDNFTRHFKFLLRKAELKDIPFHRLRHTFATMALEAGIPVKTVQEILGHSTSRMLMDIYAHVTPAMHREAARRIGGVVAGMIKK